MSGTVLSSQDAATYLNSQQYHQLEMIITPFVMEKVGCKKEERHKTLDNLYL